ncbi:MAG TPA: sigma-70 family RNA polymerase sigma factor [Vicinamibacterales bacterium]|nr:sigma-70 family RNA polymerase sigma factor [Vicinamibacterales bacterium]
MSDSHAADVDLARLCERGDEQAWDRFVREYRPLLYRAADALDRTGRARELADALYADLYARSLFKYFQGRSSLATWLRAVLAQRYVDALRAEKKLAPLDDRHDAASHESASSDPDRPRYLAAMQSALGASVGALADRDRLRLAMYYVQSMTLAEIGRLTKEHEATVSRHLARTRKQIRTDVESRLRAELSADEIDACFASVSGDPGEIDISRMLGYKERTQERSI